MDNIITDRLILRNINEMDIGVIARLFMDEKVRQYLGGRLSKDKASEKAKSLVGKEGYYVITFKGGENLLGLCNVGIYRTGEVEVSYELFPEYWGRGYAKEAVSAVIKWSFNNMKPKKIIAVTQAKNTQSQKLLESLGMTKTQEFIEYDEKQVMYEINSS